MREARVLPYLGPAFVLYLVAAVASSEGYLDWGGALVAFAAVFVAFLGPVRSRQSDLAGSFRIGLLGLCAGTVLVSAVHPGSLLSAVGLAEVVALAGFGGLLGDLAMSVPDRLLQPGRGARFYFSRLLSYELAAICGALGLMAVAPAASVFGEPWLAPAWLAHVPWAFAALSIPVALGLRLMRRRAGSSPEALAANGWAVLGLTPAALMALSLGSLRVLGALDPGHGLHRAGLVAAALFVMLSHVLMIDARFRFSAGRTGRNAVAAVLTIAVAATVLTYLRVALGAADHPLTLGLLVAATLLASAAFYRGLQPMLQNWLAPFRGRLLRAVDAAVDRMGHVSTLQQLGRAVLGPMRAASDDALSEPLLYCFDPPMELRIDAAGEPHLASRVMSPAIQDALRERRGDIVLRQSLETRIVRQPHLRPLVQALVALDALCVVPLSAQGELEGALIIPKGARTDELTLEEMEALRGLSLFLAAFVSLLSAAARAQQRAADLMTENRRAERRIQLMERETERLRADVHVLKAGHAAGRLATPQIAYSQPMQHLLDRIRNVGASDAPVLLVAEEGIPLDALAFCVHTQSSKSKGAFVVGDCASVSAEQAGAALFGEEREGGLPGWLPLAAQGSLLILNVPAMPREVQRTLAWALATRQAQRLNADDPYAIDVRVIATTRVELQALVQAKSFDAQLASRFEAATLHVPPLRERPEDLHSLVLLELHQAARVLGREVVGIEDEALRTLQGYAWPGNLRELQSVVERAVVRCEAPRVRPQDLPLPAAPTAEAEPESVLAGTFEAIERRVLLYAIDSAGGNKSEAARRLGLKRTTFLDKLRRHRLDNGRKSQPVTQESVPH